MLTLLSMLAVFVHPFSDAFVDFQFDSTQIGFLHVTLDIRSQSDNLLFDRVAFVGNRLDIRSQSDNLLFGRVEFVPNEIDFMVNDREACIQHIQQPTTNYQGGKYAQQPKKTFLIFEIMIERLESVLNSPTYGTGGTEPLSGKFTEHGERGKSFELCLVVGGGASSRCRRRRPEAVDQLSHDNVMRQTTFDLSLTFDLHNKCNDIFLPRGKWASLTHFTTDEGGGLSPCC
jgi:hypothetical protein